MKHIVCRRTALGEIGISAGEAALTGLFFGVPAAAVGADAGCTPLIAEAFLQLDAWLSGDLRAFTLPLAPEGSGFKRRVWSALSEIPYGQTRSYAEVAVAIGSPGASRAVGAACASNPLPIVIPCHRVVRSDGSIGGYLGGVPVKRWLLELERRNSP